MLLGDGKVQQGSFKGMEMLNEGKLLQVLCQWDGQFLHESVHLASSEVARLGCRPNEFFILVESLRPLQR